MESVSLLDSSSSSSSSSVHVAPSSSSSATDASDGDDVSPPVNPPRRLRRAPIDAFPAPTRSRVGVVPPGDSKDPSKDDRSPSGANGSSSAYDACPRSGRASGADRARESRRISFSRCRRPLGDVASGARVARRVGRVGVETDRSITGRPGRLDLRRTRSRDGASSRWRWRGSWPSWHPRRGRRTAAWAWAWASRPASRRLRRRRSRWSLRLPSWWGGDRRPRVLNGHAGPRCPAPRPCLAGHRAGYRGEARSIPHRRRCPSRSTSRRARRVARASPSLPTDAELSGG